MKLIQANIWGGRLDKQIMDFLEAEQADIVCLQEAIDTKGDGMMSVTVSDIKQKIGYTHLFFSPVFSFNLMEKVAGFGNAILAKFPISKQNTIFTRLEYKEDFDFDIDDYNIRNLQHAVVEMNGKKVNVLNHHGHHVRSHKDGDAETLRQCKIIAQYVEQLDGPVILTGDFNLNPASESLEHINNILTNLSATHKLKTTRNQLTHKKEVCDYIFVSSDIKVTSFYASDELISDHMALVLDFDL